jgi:hypothetical protein
MAKKRPYDAMRDESSRAITAMPYTETKPKPKVKSKAPPPKAKGRPYDPVKDEPTSRPFKKGGSVKMAAGGSFSEAFRTARKGGDKTFTWRGKSYTTELAGEKPAAKSSAPAAKPAAKSSAPAAKPAAKPAPRTPTGLDNYDAFKTMTGRTNTEANKAKDAEKRDTYTNLNRARLRDIRTEGNRADMRRDTVARSKQFRPASAPSASGETPYQMARSVSGASKRDELAARYDAPESKEIRRKMTRKQFVNANLPKDDATLTPGRKVTGRPGQALKRGGKVKKKYV